MKPTLTSNPAKVSSEVTQYVGLTIVLTCAKAEANADPVKYKFFKENDVQTSGISGTRDTVFTYTVLATDADKTFKCQYFNADAAGAKLDSDAITLKIKGRFMVT